MQHGNKKYNFEALQSPGDTIKVKPASIYSLKSAMRGYFNPKGTESPIKINDHFSFKELGGGNFQVTRV